MGYPTGEIESAAIARLRGDSTLAGLLGNPASPPGAIYDAGAVPTNAAFPYVVTQPLTTQEGTLLSFGMDAKDVYLQITAFTKYPGFSQARALVKQICALFDQQGLTLANGFTNPFLLFEDAQEMEDGETGVRWIPVKFKLYTQG